MAVKKTGGVAAQVEALVRATIEGMGLVLWDVRYEKEGVDWFLKVLIDKKEGYMDTDTCEAVTRAINPIIDEADPISQSYYLEVGSPGLGRKLTKDEHFEACKGEKVLAHLVRPDEKDRREIEGILLGLQEDTVVLQLAEDEEVAVPLKSAAYFKLCDDEDLFG